MFRSSYYDPLFRYILDSDDGLFLVKEKDVDSNTAIHKAAKMSKIDPSYLAHFGSRHLVPELRRMGYQV